MTHQAVAFWEREYTAQHATKFTTDEDGLVVRSVCPQCQGDTDWPIAVVRPGASRSVAATADGEATPSLPDGSYVVCACGFPHDKRPADAGENGCGAYWPILDPIT